jgi:hypothetical protein
MSIVYPDFVPRYGTIDNDYAMRLATCAPGADGGVYMLNLMKYRDRADYGSGGETGVSGREADDRYAPVDVLAAIGASVCFVADVVEASEAWDRVAVVRYPTRLSFIEMQSREDFQRQHTHKEAGMDHTIVMGTLPVDGVPSRARPNRVLLEVWHGAAPAPAVPGAAVAFDVEGTIVGDRRPWAGARYTVLDGDARVDTSAGTPTNQLIVLQPVIERWT